MRKRKEIFQFKLFLCIYTVILTHYTEKINIKIKKVPPVLNYRVALA